MHLAGGIRRRTHFLLALAVDHASPAGRSTHLRRARIGQGGYQVTGWEMMSDDYRVDTSKTRAAAPTCFATGAFVR